MALRCWINEYETQYGSYTETTSRRALSILRPAPLQENMSGAHSRGALALQQIRVPGSAAYRPDPFGKAGFLSDCLAACFHSCVLENGATLQDILQFVIVRT